MMSGKVIIHNPPVMVEPSSIEIVKLLNKLDSDLIDIFSFLFLYLLRKRKWLMAVGFGG